MSLHRLRIVVRIIERSSFRAVQSAITSTQRFNHNHVYKGHILPSSVHKMQTRQLSSQDTPVSDNLTVDYDYVKKATSNHGTLIIDVREPEEVKENGKIPNSINIPLSNVVPVLSNLTESEFHQIYERSKPKEDTEMIFYCMIGKRSQKAQQNAINLGFKNAKNYLGSWTDWATRTH